MRKPLPVAGLLLIILAAILYIRPVPSALPQLNSIRVNTSSPLELPWPAQGQAAFGAAGYGLLEDNSSATPAPIGSVAKVITALAVLQKKPITLGAQGPVITFSKADADLFDYYYLRDGSVAKVSAGEQLTEYQALEAMLLPSANNMADSLAIWAFGSIQAYADYANTMVRSLGLLHTTVGGASGFDDKTTSTADDLVNLGLRTLGNPQIKKIVAETEATLPVAGTVKNVNWLLGQDGVIGIKTGNTQKAGGCYLFAAQRPIGGQNITVVGAILGAKDLNVSIRQADKVIKAGDSGFEQITVLHKNQKIGRFSTPWGAAADIVAAKDVPLLVWKGSAVKIKADIDTFRTPVKAGARVGSVYISNSDKSIGSPVIINDGLPGPGWAWRLTHH